MNLIKWITKQFSRNPLLAQPAVSGSAELDYSLKTGEKVWFTYKTNPRSSDDWIEAEILDLNWAYKAAALQLKGYKGVSCHGISALSRVRHYH